MQRFGRNAPAVLWRAFFVFALAASGAAVFAAGTPAGNAPLTSAQAGEMIAQARDADIPGNYYLEFELIALPRRGEERTYHGRLWGTQTPTRLKRIEVTDGPGAPLRFLLQSGPQPAIWRWSEGKLAQLGPDELFAPLLPGLELTPFDLQMPYLYWPDVVLQGEERIRNRPANVFVFRAPAELAREKSAPAAARVYLDAQLNAPVQTELLDARNKVLKRFTPLALKMVDNQALPKTVDYRNEATGDKARLNLTGAALHVPLDPAIFAPRALAQAVPPPAAHVVRIE